MSSLRMGFVAGILLISSAFAISAHADTVTGKIVGPDGKPVSGATIYAMVFSPTVPYGIPATKTLTSDASGAFSLDVPPIPAQKEKNPMVAQVSVAASGFGLA